MYEQSGIDIPNNLLDRFSLESAVDVLCSISTAIREKGVIVRIVGTSGMGYIIAYILTIFPEDSLITVEGMIINAGAR